jgi:signal peptidase I
MSTESDQNHPRAAEGAEGVEGAEDAVERSETGQDPFRRGTLMVLRETVIVIGMALLLSLVVKTWLMQAFYIPSESMESTLLKGDRVIVSKLVPSPIDLKRGDVVVFEDPDHWLPPAVPIPRTELADALHSTLTFVGLLPSDEGNHLIKRVIGLPGDHVVCCDVNQKLTVNGVPLTEPYLFAGDAPSQQSFDITVPAGRVWVMGDHRSNSADSRPHDERSGGAKGSVPESLIVGRALSVVWPIHHWAWLANPGGTFAKVPAATAR